MELIFIKGKESEGKLVRGGRGISRMGEALGSLSLRMTPAETPSSAVDRA